MGRRRRRGRNVHGILLLDKPAGMTSNQTLQAVRREYDAARAGHTGSLDPLATGLLPICLGEATKVSGYLLDADKSYRFTVRFGITTDSGDADGVVIDRRDPAAVTRAQVESALVGLRGNIRQVPPMHSAIKRGGQPLYRLAHQGIEVEREPRPARIDQLELLAFDGRDAELAVTCSKGTYVRSLAVELGAELGPGAHVTTLRRTRAGPFDATELVTLERLRDVAASQGHAAADGLLLPVDAGLADWPRVDMAAELADFIRQGQSVQIPGAPASGTLRLYDRTRGFLGIGTVGDDGLVGPKRLMNL